MATNTFLHVLTCLLFFLTQLASATDTYVAIHNLTPFTLTRTGISSTYVDQVRWATFPETISSGTVAEAHVSYELKDSSDNDFLSTVTYSVGETGGTVQIYLQQTSLYVNLNGLNLQVNGNVAATIPLGFESEGGQRTPLFLGGGVGGTNIVTNYKIHNWMQANLDTIGCQPLRRLVMPGSHDAGMSEFNYPTALVGAYDVVTQTMSIYDQLLAGVRYFDIRPTISHAQFYTGHYDFNVFWLGANGQSMADVINDVNRFTASYSELVILSFSNSLVTDADYEHFNAEQWAAFLEYTKQFNNRFAVQNTPDLTALTLRDYIGSGQPAVLLLNNDGSHSSNQVLAGTDGWYDTSFFPLTGSYAATISRDDMRSDQLAKLAENRKSPDDPMFMMFWTLTTGANPNGIVNWAKGIYTNLFDAPQNGQGSDDGGLLNGFSGVFGMTHANRYPNIVLIDAVPDDGRLAVLTSSMNRFYATCQNPARGKRAEALLNGSLKARVDSKRCSGQVCA